MVHWRSRVRGRAILAAVYSAAFYPEDETRVRWLRPEEEILVLEPLPSPFRELAKLAALTLMRQGELRTLRRKDVHLEQGVVMLPRAKAGARDGGSCYRRRLLRVAHPPPRQSALGNARLKVSEAWRPGSLDQ
jgi:integrase